MRKTIKIIGLLSVIFLASCQQQVEINCKEVALAIVEDKVKNLPKHERYFSEQYELYRPQYKTYSTIYSMCRRTVTQGKLAS